MQREIVAVGLQNLFALNINMSLRFLSYSFTPKAPLDTRSEAFKRGDAEIQFPDIMLLTDRAGISPIRAF